MLHPRGAGVAYAADDFWLTATRAALGAPLCGRVPRLNGGLTLISKPFEGI